MSLVCDFTIHLRVIAADGVTVRGDLNDQSAGLSLRRPILKPDGELLWERYTSPRAVGDFTSGPPRAAAGDLVVTVLAEGSSWPQVNTLWATAVSWLTAESHFFVELEEDGVTTRWQADRPPVSPVGYDRRTNRLEHQVRFHCQPNPSVTIAP